MKRSRLRPLGKKGRQWASKRRGLKIEFEARGITRCELQYDGCAGDDFLGFAHAAKRRKLKVEDLGHVILACGPCHDKIELLPPEQMKGIVDQICRERESMLISQVS